MNMCIDRDAVQKEMLYIQVNYIDCITARKWICRQRQSSEAQNQLVTYCTLSSVYFCALIVDQIT